MDGLKKGEVRGNKKLGIKLKSYCFQKANIFSECTNAAERGHEEDNDSNERKP